MNKIERNYVSKLTLRETQEALIKIEDVLKEKISNKIDILFVRSPIYSSQKNISNNASSKGRRQINFDCSNDNAVYYLFDDYKFWMLNTITKMDIKNNNAIGAFVSYIERDGEIKNTNSLEKRALEIEYRFDNKEKSFEKGEELFSLIFSAILETQKEIKKDYKKLKKPFPKKTNRIEIGKFSKDKNYDEQLNEIAISEGYFTLEKKFVNSSSSLFGNYEISLLGLSKDILESNEIFNVKDRKTFDDIESEFSVSEFGKEEYTFSKMILKGKNPRTINISIDIDALSMAILEKSHILEVQSSMNIKEIEKILDDAGVEHI